MSEKCECLCKTSVMDYGDTEYNSQRCYGDNEITSGALVLGNVHVIAFLFNRRNCSRLYRFTVIS